MTFLSEIEGWPVTVHCDGNEIKSITWSEEGSEYLIHPKELLDSEIARLKSEAKRIDTSNLTDIEVDGIDTRDCPDFVDAHITSATWKDTGKELSDEELDRLNEEEPEFIHEKVWERLF